MERKARNHGNGGSVREDDENRPGSPIRDPVAPPRSDLQRLNLYQKYTQQSGRPIRFVERVSGSGRSCHISGMFGERRGKLTFSTNLSNWLLAVPGSPSRRTLISPLSLIPSGSCFREPPNNRQVIAFLMSAQQWNKHMSVSQWRDTEKPNHRCFHRYLGPRSLQMFRKSSHFEPSRQTLPLPLGRTAVRKDSIPYHPQTVSTPQDGRF